MKLWTKAIEKKMPALGSTEGQGKEAEVIVKYFNPYGAGTWLITEGEKQKDGDWLLYGYCHIFEWEWGYILLSELEKTRINLCGMRTRLPLERDLYAKGKVKDLV